MNEDKRKYDWAKAIEERGRRDLVEWLEDNQHIYRTSSRKRTVDFYIGDPDDYPETFNDDQLNVIARSSFTSHQNGVEKLHEGLFVTETKLHLPPAPEELREDIDEELNLPEGVGVHYGSGALGGLPAPEGVVTPHVIDTSDLTYDDVRRSIEELVDVYVEVYDCGNQAIQKQPEQ